MEQDHTFRVNLKVADRAFPLRVPNVTEESYHRHAADMLNKRLNEFNEIYGVNVDLQQKLILVALEALVDAQKINSSYQRLQEDVQNKLDELDSKIPEIQ